MPSRAAPKGPEAFRTISETALAVGAPQHVLRFWETKFDFITPVKRAGGRRLYRPQDVTVLKAVRRLLHDEGLTIRGVQRLHREQGPARLAAWAEPGSPFALDARALDGDAPTPPSGSDDGHARLRAALAQVEAARDRLDAALAA